MKQIHAIFLGILLILSSLNFFLFAGETSQKISKMHQDIGKELIMIRNDNLDLQSRIYPLLDQVSNLYRIASNIIKRKKEIKLALKQEQSVFLKIKQENAKLKDDVDSLKKALEIKNNQFNQSQQRVSDLMDEKNNLIKKNIELDSKEKEYSAKLQAIEASETKPKIQPDSQKTGEEKIE